MKISNFLILLIAMITLVFTACDDGNDGGGTTPDKCDGVVCEIEGQVCDPGDGKCYGGIVDKCNPNPCAAGQVCNPTDGSCKDLNLDELDTIVKARMFSSSNDNKDGVILTKPLTGVVVAVRGLPTSSKHAVVIRQADANEYAGIYVNLDGIKALPNFPILAIGNLVSIKGKLVEYFDRTELQPQSVADLVVDSASAPVPTPIDLSSVAFEEKYESMILNLTNIPFTVTEAISINRCDTESPCASGADCKNGQCADNVYDTTLTDGAGKTVKVSSSFAYPRITLALGDTVNKVVGAMIFDYGEFKMYPRSQEDVGAEVAVCDPACTGDEVCVNGTCVTPEAEDNDAKCSDGIDNDHDGHTDCEDYDCSKSDTVTVCKVTCGGIECATGEVCIGDVCSTPVPERDDDTLCSDGIDNDGNGFTDCEDFGCSKSALVTVCKVTCGGVECAAGQVCDANDACSDPAVDKCAGVTCGAGEACDPSDGSCITIPTKTLAEIRTAEAGLSNDGFADGGTYSTSGTVTAILATGSNMGFYMQDATGGIYVYTKAVTPTVTLGDTVTVTGQVGNYYGLLRFLETATIGTSVAGTVPTVKEIAPTAANLVEANEGMFVKFTGAQFTVTEAVSSSNHHTTTLTDGTNTFAITDSLFAFEATVGTVYTSLQGILSYHYGKYKLLPREAGDMAMVTFDCTATPCADYQTCTADDTCTLTPGMCADDNDCAATEECNAEFVCITPAPVCDPVCADHKTCTATDTCTLNSGMCDVVGDCTDGATSCDNNVCVGGTAPQFDNNDFSTWTNDTTPADWRIGNSGFALSKVVVAGTDFALGILGTNEGNKYVVTTPLLTATSTVPTSLTFDMNGSGKLSVNISCTDSSDNITKKTYNLDATADIATRTDLTVSGSNAYVEFGTDGAWKTFTIGATDLGVVWLDGSDCAIEFKAGKNFEFNASLDNIMINY